MGGELLARLLAESGDPLGEARLVARSGVPVDHALLCRLVDDAEGLAEHRLGLRRVAARHRGAEALDGSAQARALAAVALPHLDVLTVPLLCRLRIGHYSSQYGLSLRSY